MNKQLEVKVSGKRLREEEKTSKTSHVSETHALIQVSFQSHWSCS